MKLLKQDSYFFLNFGAKIPDFCIFKHRNFYKIAGMEKGIKGWNKERFQLYTFGVLTFIFGYLVMFYAENQIKADTPYGALELQLSTQITEFETIFEAWGDTGKMRLLKFMWFDYAYALSYSVFLYLLFMKLENGRNSWLTSLSFLPFLIGILDIIENSLEIGFVSSTILLSNFTENLHQAIVFAKWSIVILFFIVLVLQFLLRYVFVSKYYARNK